jgi:hypothetical protein
VPSAGYSALRPGTHPAPGHLNDGARGPKTQTHPINPQTASNQNSGSKPERVRCVHTRPKSLESPERPTRTVSAMHNAG